MFENVGLDGLILVAKSVEYSVAKLSDASNTIAKSIERAAYMVGAVMIFAAFIECAPSMLKLYQK